MDFPLTAEEKESIPARQKTLITFQKQLEKIIKKNEVTADLLQLTLKRSSNSYYFGFSFDHQLWLLERYTEMGKMQSNSNFFTEKYCAQLFEEYSRFIPQLESLEELSRTLPILIHSSTYLWKFNQEAIHVCTQPYPKLRLYAAPHIHQAIQKLKNNLLAFLSTEITRDFEPNAEFIDQRIIWFSQFLQSMGTKAPEGK